MNRWILKLRDPESWAEPLDRAIQTLREGAIIAFPTDTVYGLGADPFSEEAIRALFHAKGRPEVKPIALLVSNRDDVASLALDVPENAFVLMERFWPGPLTLVMRASTALPERLLAGRDTVGIRMPDHPIALELLRRFGGPLAVTSANRSGEPDLRNGMEVENALGASVSLVLDGGPTPGDAPSTVLDLTSAPPRVLREGPIHRDQLEAATGMRFG